MRLLLCLLAMSVLASCDRWEGVTLRNDGAEPLTVVWSVPGGRETPLPAPLGPGKAVDVGFIAGPPGPRQDLVVKAFDPRGALVYCRRFTPSEHQRPSSRDPVSVKPGELRCT